MRTCHFIEWRSASSADASEPVAAPDACASSRASFFDSVRNHPMPGSVHPNHTVSEYRLLDDTIAKIERRGRKRKQRNKK